MNGDLVSLTEHWEKRSKEFENIPEKSPEVDILIGFIRDLQPQKILEIGCNYGRELKYLENMGELFGIDFNASNIKNANSYIPGDFVLGNATALPYNSNSFDFVYTDGLLSHILPEDIGKVLQEIFRTSSRYILLIEYLGTRSGRNLIENCKKFTWIHDYDRFISTLNCSIKYNKERFFGTDLYKIILLEKNVGKILIKEKEKTKKKRFFEFKLGKFNVGIG